MPTLLDIFNNNWLNTQYVPGALPHFSSKIIILCAFLSQFCLIQPKNYFLSSVFLRYFLLKHLPFFLFLTLASLPPFLPFSSPCAYILLFLLFVSALFLAGLKIGTGGRGGVKAAKLLQKSCNQCSAMIINCRLHYSPPDGKSHCYPPWLVLYTNHDLFLLLSLKPVTLSLRCALQRWER